MAAMCRAVSAGATGDAEQIRKDARDLVAREPDVIVAVSTPAVAFVRACMAPRLSPRCWCGGFGVPAAFEAISQRTSIPKPHRIYESRSIPKLVPSRRKARQLR